MDNAALCRGLVEYRGMFGKAPSVFNKAPRLFKAPPPKRTTITVEELDDWIIRARSLLPKSRQSGDGRDLMIQHIKMAYSYPTWGIREHEISKIIASAQAK
jgi:hypothetical protein